MNRPKVTAERVMDVTREVVAERPGYVYSAPEHMDTAELDCLYVHTDADGSNPVPGCAVAHVLNRLGVPLDALAIREGDSAYPVVGAVLDISGDAADAQTFLNSVQMAQDAGRTWGDALEYAETYLTSRAA